MTPRDARTIGRRCRLGVALATTMLVSGCSLLGDDGAPGIAPPPMLGALLSDDDTAQPKRRAKIRFASEVANSREKHQASPRSPAYDAENSPGEAVASAAPWPAHNDAARDYAPPATLYPHTVPHLANAPVPPIYPYTKRLPDVRQLAYDDVVGGHAAAFAPTSAR